MPNSTPVSACDQRRVFWFSWLNIHDPSFCFSHDSPYLYTLYSHITTSCSRTAAKLHREMNAIVPPFEIRSLEVKRLYWIAGFDVGFQSEGTLKCFWYQSEFNLDMPRNVFFPLASTSHETLPYRSLVLILRLFGYCYLKEQSSH